MSKGVGYLLPSGDALEEDLQCLIVFYPNRDEYRRALFGSLDYLGTWIAWERDDLKRGKDAALSWLAANEATRECLAMAACDTIIDLLVQIEKNTRTCCGESNYVQYGPNTVVTTVIVPGAGPDPTLYGQTAVADWEEWLEYVCYHAHLLVDDLIDTAEKLDLAVQAGGYVLDFIAHLFSIVQWRMVEDLIPVNFSVIQAIFNALGEGAITGEFLTLASDLEDAREDIVCALINGLSLEDAIQDVVGTGVLWTVYYSWLDYDTMTAIIYEGQLPGVAYLDPVKRDDCLCTPDIGEYQTCVDSYSDDPCGWMGSNGIDGIQEAYGNPAWGARTRYDIGQMRASTSQLRLEVGLTAGDPAQTVTIKRVTFDYKTDNINHGGLKLTFDPNGQDVQVTFPNNGVHVWDSIDYTLPTPVTVPYNAWAVSWRSNGGSGGYLYLDNVMVDFDAPV